MILGRIAQSLLLVVAVSFISFLLIYKMGNPAEVLASPNATAADLERVTHEFGLDRPFLDQYLTFLTRLSEGDFGRSFVVGEPALARPCPPNTSASPRPRALPIRASSPATCSPTS